MPSSRFRIRTEQLAADPIGQQHIIESAAHLKERGLKVDALLQYLWSDWRIGLSVAAGLAAFAALLTTWLTPRGPITTIEAVSSMVVALLIGAIAGLLAGSRWSILVTPLVFILLFERARIGVDGPTVDMIYLNSTYGLIAFLLGRLVHGLLVLAPMILGTIYGLSLAARLGKESLSSMGLAGWMLTILATMSLIVVALAIARPAATHPIIGPDGNPLPGSIAELVTVPIGGRDQVMMVRGRNVKNPVLLYLAGGPGGTDLGAMRADTSLEQDFVVVTWEQRGAGKSYAALDPVQSLTLDRTVADTIEVTNYLRDRFGQEKIYLVGNSWGTILGVLAAQQRPELFHAYIGTGQMVSPRETDIIFYEDTLAWSEATRDDALASTLLENGPPPYDNIRKYEPVISHEHAWNPYPDLDTSKEMPSNLFVPENALMDRINGLRAFLDTFSVLYPQIQNIDFRQDAVTLDIPVYMAQGKYEARGRSVLASQWFDMLDAPEKEKIIFEHSGHRPLFEEPAQFANFMAWLLRKTS